MGRGGGHAWADLGKRVRWFFRTLGRRGAEESLRMLGNSVCKTWVNRKSGQGPRPSGVSHSSFNLTLEDVREDCI